MEDDLIKYERLLVFYEEAYKTLLKAIMQPDINEYIKDSIVQRFEYTLEMAWKALRAYMIEFDGIEMNSPKKVIRAAFEQGYIGENIALWDEAFDARNKTSHEYGAEHGNMAFKFACDNHQIFNDLLKLLKTK